MLDAGTCDSHCINFLKSVGADKWRRHLTGDDYYRSGIHVGVGDAGHGICGAGPGGNQRNPDTARGTGITLGHVHGALFMAHEVVRHAIARAPKLVVDVKDSSTGITENRIDALMQECFDQNLCSTWLRYV